ncbi:MAG: cytochrome P450 [Pseudomonadales bacterium]
MEETTLLYDPLDSATVDNPFDAFRALRDEAPVYHMEREDLWYLSRYEDVEAALFDWRTFSSAQGSQVREDPQRIGKTMTTNDPPRHDQIRRLVQIGFTPKRVQAHAERINNLTDDLIAQLPDDGFDFVSDFAGPLTGLVIGSLIGVPDEDLELIRKMIDEGLSFTDEFPNGKGLKPVFDYVLELVADRRANPGADMMSAFCGAEDAGFTMSDLDIAVTCGSILGAGFSSTGHQLGNIAFALHQLPDVRRKVLADPGLIPNLIEESLRWDVSTMAFARQTTREVELHGATIPADARVVCLLSSANRDDRQYDRADEFVLDRENKRHLGWGHGIHHCMGSALARLEMRTALEKILPILGEFDIDLERAVRLKHLNFRGHRELPVRVAS